MTSQSSVPRALPAALLGLTAWIITAAASADVVTLINSSAFGNSWDNGPDWSDGQPAQAGNEYHVGDSTGTALRTPNDVNDPIFPGDSLTLHTTGVLGTKHNGTATIADFRLDGGTIGTWVGNRTMGIGGTLTVLAPSAIDASGTGSRTIVIHSLLTGAAGLTVSGNADNGFVRLTNGANTYTGDWTVASGILQAQGAGSLGSGNVTVAGGAQIDVDYDLNNTADWNLDGVMVLDQSHTNGGLFIGGSPVAAGAYSFAVLNGAFDAHFADGGSGSITVTSGVAGGTVYELNKSQPFGNSWNTGADWTNTGDGTTGVVPAFGTIANVNGRGLRTPTSSDTFAATLNLNSGATLLLKTSGTATVIDGHLAGGALSQGIAPNSTGTFGGRFAVDADSNISINSTATDVRTMILAADLSGAGQLTVDGGDGAGPGTLRLTGNNSAYSGDWLLRDLAVLQAESAGSIGAGNITVQTGSQLDVDYNLVTAAHLDLAGSMVLDQYHTVGALTVGGTVLAPGTYDYAFLNANYDPYFADGGSGSISVGTAYQLNASQPFGTSWNDGSYWTNIGDGTTGVVPAAGTIANVDGLGLRTPTSSDTFDARLNLQSGSTLLLKASGTSTLADGHLLGGTIGQGIAPNSTGTVAGNLAVDSSSTVSVNSTSGDVRTLILAADLSGSAQLTVDGGDGGGAPFGTLRLTGDNSAFSGNWLLQDNALLKAESAGSLGAGSVAVQAGSRLDADYDINTAGNLDLAGSMVLDQNHTVGALSVGGAAFAQGTFDFAFLNTYFDTHFVDGGSGSITTTSGAAQGTVYELNAGQPLGTSWNDGAYWTNTGDNSTGVVPAAGTIANVNGLGLRTPSSSDTFGATLNLMGGSTLGLKTTGTATLADGHLQGGTLSMSVAPNATGTIGGNVAVDSNSSVNLASTGSDHRTMILAADLSGSADLDVYANSGYGTLRLTGDNSAYSGDWLVRDFARVQTETDGALGPGSVTLNNSGHLYVNSTENIAGLTGGDSAEMRIGYNDSGSLTVAPGTVQFGVAGTPGNIYVGNRGDSGTGNYHGVLDLSGSTFTAYLTNFDLGTSRSGDNAETAQGTVTLGNVNTVDANRLLISDSTNSNQSGLGVASTLHLGQTNTFGINTVTVGGRKGEALVDIVAGGSLDLTAQGGGRADLYIGRNNVNSGTQARGTLDLSGGASFTALLDSLVLGQKTGGGSGTAQGTLILADANNIDANAVLVGDSENGGQTGFSSTIRLGNTNTILADTFTIGGRKSNAEVTLPAGGSLVLGDAARQVDLYLGRRTSDTGTNNRGVVDLSDGDSFTAYFGTLAIGTATGSSGGSQGKPSGELLLAADNTIHAETIVIAHSPAVGLGGYTSSIVLGQSNAITADTLTVGGSKGTGLVEFDAGGTLDLGTPADRVDVFIGNQTVSTAGGSTGTMDMTGGVLNAWIDELTIAQKVSGAQGTTRGTLDFEAGTIDANSIVMAVRNGTGTAEANFNFSGGTVRAGSIEEGGGTANFNWTGGRLSVDTFGFDLVQDGGTLAPGDGPGTTLIQGAYTQNDGTFEVEISGLDQGLDPGYDFVDVSGSALLEGTVQVFVRDGFRPVGGDTFDVLTATDVTLGVDFGLDQSNTGLPPGGGFIYRVLDGGNGQILQLQFVPEPASLLLLGLGVLGVLLIRRRGH